MQHRDFGVSDGGGGDALGTKAVPLSLLAGDTVPQRLWVQYLAQQVSGEKETSAFGCLDSWS